MKKKTIAGLITIVAIVAVVMFAGCIEEEAPLLTPTPTPKPTAAPASFEIEYPVTAYFEPEGGSFQLTFHEDGTAVVIDSDGEVFYGKWRILDETISKITYKFGDEGSCGEVVLFSNHDAILEPESPWSTLGCWK